MTKAQFDLLKSYYDFIVANFAGTPAWQQALIDEFESCTLTAEQTQFLLDPAHATSEFNDHFKQAVTREAWAEISADISKATTQLSGAFIEPLNALANQAIYLEFGSEQQVEDTKKALVPQLAVIGKTIPQNLQTLLGRRISPEIQGIYDKIKEFAQRAAELVEEEGLETVKDVKGMEGLHYIDALPEDFGEITPQP